MFVNKSYRVIRIVSRIKRGEQQEPKLKENQRYLKDNRTKYVTNPSVANSS